MKKYIIISSLAVAAALTGCDNIEDVYQYGDNQGDVNWEEAANLGTDALIEYFWNEDRGYFNNQSGVANGDGWNYWPQAHAMDVVIDAYLRTGNEKYSSMFGQWYEGIKHQSGGSHYNDFYDDEEWIVLTMLRLYEVTGEDRYINTALDLWNDIKTAWNTEYGGGGMAWKHTQPWSKNACSNAPASLIACRLYSIRKEAEDLEWALKIYGWTRDNLFNPATGAVYDGLNGQNGELNKISLTYNQGTFMATAHMLYKFTGDAVYLKDARRAANFCITRCIDVSNNILRDEGNGDGELFKGIFMRYFVDMLNEKDLDQSYRNKFVTFFNNNAVVLWTRGVADKRQIFFGPKWENGPQGSTSLNGQTAGATMLEMKARFDKK